jgi:hypothetical protein
MHEQDSMRAGNARCIMIARTPELYTLENDKLGGKNFLIFIHTIVNRSDVSGAIDVNEHFVESATDPLLQLEHCGHVKCIHDLEFDLSRYTKTFVGDCYLCVGLIDADNKRTVPPCSTQNAFPSELCL